MRMFLFYAIIQDMEKLERLNQYISKSGRCSRREADTAISEGRVKINGELAQLGMRVQAVMWSHWMTSSSNTVKNTLF